MKKNLIVLCLVALTTSVSYADFNWFNVTSNKVSYADGITPLVGNRTDSSVGCFVQLIWAGPNDSIDPVSLSGDGVTGDDVVHATSWFGRNVFGDGSGRSPTVETFTGDLSTFYYVRAWSAPAADYNSGLIPTATTNFYGNSELWSNPGSEPGPDEFNFGGNGDANGIGWSTDISVAAVPEPGSVMLALLGLLSARFFRRHLKRD